MLKHVRVSMGQEMGDRRKSRKSVWKEPRDKQGMGSQLDCGP